MEQTRVPAAVSTDPVYMDFARYALGLSNDTPEAEIQAAAAAVEEYIAVMLVCDAMLLGTGGSLNTGQREHVARDRVMIRRRHGIIDGEKRTPKEAGAELGLSTPRIRQIELKELSMMKHAINRRNRERSN